MTKKVHILSIPATDEYIGLGISSSEPELQLAMLINSVTKFNLALKTPIQKTINDEIIRFPHCYFSNENDITCHLIKNIHKGCILLPKISKIDFFLLIQAHHSSRLAENISQELLENPNVSLIISLNTQQLKSLRQLL